MSKMGSQDNESHRGGSIVGSSRKRKTTNDDSIESIRGGLEAANFATIERELAGKLDLQSLVIKLLQKGSLENKKVKCAQDVKLAAPSTNKFNMLSCENWIDIFVEMDPDNFRHRKPALLLCSKEWLCKYGCFSGLIDPSSAIPSRKISSIAAFLKERSVSLCGSRYKLIILECNEAGQKLTQQHDFNRDIGVFSLKPADKASGNKIVHTGSNIMVDLPSEFDADTSLKNNQSEDTACLEGKFSDPLIVRVFAAAGVQLPKTWWAKKICDKAMVDVGGGLGPENIGSSSLSSEQMAAHNASMTAPVAPVSGGGFAAPAAIPE
jgi:hypothetical protein